jgi:hypothetical protein
MRNFLASVALAGALFLPAHVQAASTQQSKAEIEAFRLSMEKIKSTVFAYSNLMELLAKDPKLLERWKAAAAGRNDDKDQDRFSEAVQKISETDPRVLTAFTKAGITPKETVMTMETVAGTLLGLSMAESAGVKTTERPKGFVKENYEFVRTHKAEVLSVLASLEDLAKKYPSIKLDSRDVDGAN